MPTPRPAKVLCASAFATFLVMAQPAGATTIGFDDLLGGGVSNQQISSPYAGLTWNNFYVLDTALYNGQNGSSGYSNGVVSLNNVGFTGFGNPGSFSAAQPFELDSYYVGAGWNDGMSVTVTGWLNGQVVATDSFLVSTSGSLLRTPHWSGIDTVTISSTGGVNHGYNGSGTQVYLDNIVVNAPEPATLAIFGLGLAATALLRRRTA